MKIGYLLVEVMVTVIIFMQSTNEDPQLLAMVSIAEAQANADNASKLVEDARHYNERMLKMKETLVKERTKGQDLKRKHDDTLLEFERLKKAYQALESDKDALVLLVTITEGEKKDLESKVLELETQKSAASK